MSHFDGYIYSCPPRIWGVICQDSNGYLEQHIVWSSIQALFFSYTRITCDNIIYKLGILRK
jgi:hypothetical protein